MLPLPIDSKNSNFGFLTFEQMKPLFDKAEIEKLKKDADLLKMPESGAAPGNSKPWQAHILTRNSEALIESATRDFQEILGEKAKVSYWFEDKNIKRPFVRFFMEPKDAGFALSGLSAPYIELAEEEKGLEGCLKLKGNEPVEKFSLEDFKTLEDGLKQVFSLALKKF
jgi:hypothetical protein